jgi:hypothetical protein
LKDGRNSAEQEDVKLRSVEPVNVRNASLPADKRELAADALATHRHFTFSRPSITPLADGTIDAAFTLVKNS